MDSTAPARTWFVAALVGLIALGAACGGASEAAAPDPHAGHGSGAADPLRPVAGDPVELGPDDDLYAVPDPLPAGPHGTLLRYQEVVPGPFPSARAYRILYLGQTLTGDATAVSGTVLVPTATVPGDGRTVIGAAPAGPGLADACAPSRDPGAEIPLMDGWTAAGHVVVVTDGEGLGTPGPHPYLVGPSAGRSVLDAVRAARQLPGAGAGEHVGLAGWAEGGHAALWADRLAAGWTPELHVVGTFAAAPTTGLRQVVEHPEEAPPASVLMVVAGLAASSRWIDPAAYLDEEGLAALARVGSTCRDEAEDALAGVDGATLVLPGGPDDTAWGAAAAANDPGLEAGDGPVLIVPGGTDGTGPLRERLCAAGQDVELRPGPAGADPAAGAHDEALAWFAARFAGEEPAASSC